MVIMGGGITGDVQINDTHLHKRAKGVYRSLEKQDVLRQLEVDPTKIPAPTRSKMMSMFHKAQSEVGLDVSLSLKENFLFNALDGSEDVLVRDKLIELVGEEIIRFREEEMAKQPARLMKDMLATIENPEGVRFRNHDDAPDDEGAELLDGEEIGEFHLEFEEEGEGDGDLATPVEGNFYFSGTMNQVNQYMLS